MVNKVILIGNLGVDPEMKILQSGTAVARLRLATSRAYKDREGNSHKQTEWHRVTAFGKLAEICGEYLRKGRLVYIEGRLRNDTWEQDGVKRYSYEIVAETMRMLGRGTSESAPEEPQHVETEPQAEVSEEDIPF